MEKTRDLKSWWSRYLREEMWSEILSRLPVKSLLRFRSVSKSWRALIDDPNFAHLHVTQFKNNRDETHLFVFQELRSFNCFVRRSSTFRISARLGSLRTCKMSRNDTFGNIPALAYVPSWYVVSLVDGLVMLRDCDSALTPELVLWNPSIRKARILPHSPQIPSGMDIYDWGLGFDPSNKDYKHVRFVVARESILHSIAVYTLGTNSWKTIQFQGKGCSIYRWDCCLESLSSIYCMGVLYLIAPKMNFGPKDLVSFDLSTEVFASIQLPNHPGPDLCSEALTLADGGCSLAVVLVSVNQGSLWVLQSSGTGNKSTTWAKRYNFSSGRCSEFKFLYLKKNADILLDERNVVTCYNPETNDEHIVLVKSINTFIITVGTYMESLMLLK